MRAAPATCASVSFSLIFHVVILAMLALSLLTVLVNMACFDGLTAAGERAPNDGMDQQ